MTNSDPLLQIDGACHHEPKRANTGFTMRDGSPIYSPFSCQPCYDVATQQVREWAATLKDTPYPPGYVEALKQASGKVGMVFLCEACHVVVDQELRDRTCLRCGREMVLHNRAFGCQIGGRLHQHVNDRGQEQVVVVEKPHGG